MHHALTRPPAPAIWVGRQTWDGRAPAVELYNLTEDIPGHPRGSTVTRQTLESAGFDIPSAAQPPRGGRRAPSQS